MINKANRHCYAPMSVCCRIVKFAAHVNEVSGLLAECVIQHRVILFQQDAKTTLGCDFSILRISVSTMLAHLLLGNRLFRIW